MKELFFGILFIMVIGFGGFVYRNAVEHPNQPIACPVDAKLCPDGTSVAREGASCTFAPCLPPNVSLDAAHLIFAMPAGFSAVEVPDSASIAAYALAATSSASSTASIVIRQYAVGASSTPSTVIQQTAISGTSGAPIAVTAFSSVELGGRRYTVAAIERFEGVVDTAYYLVRGTDVLRFDAKDSGVAKWIDMNLDLATLPAHRALTTLLTTLQVVQ